MALTLLNFWIYLKMSALLVFLIFYVKYDTYL